MSTSTLALRYVMAVFLSMGFFSGFIACGSKMYQVSVEDDVVVPDGVSEEAADPTSTMFGIHGGWSQADIPIPFAFGEDLDQEQRDMIGQAMDVWQKATGKQLFETKGDHQQATGDAFPTLYSSLDDIVNGQYKNSNWDKMGKKQFVLATAIWQGPGGGKIDRGDVHFNEQYYVIGDAFTETSDGDREVADRWTVTMHEVGHLLGLLHVKEEIDPLSIMNPALFIGEGLATRRISLGDVQRIQTIYGCDGDACDAEAIHQWIEEADDEDFLPSH